MCHRAQYRALLLLQLAALATTQSCEYSIESSSQYVQCRSIKQIVPYACSSSGGSNSKYQIHIIETDLNKIKDYDSEHPPEVNVHVKPYSNKLNITRPIVLVFHSFKLVKWRVSSEMLPSYGTYIIKTSYPLTIDPMSPLSKAQVDIIKTLPKDSQKVLRTIEALLDQPVSSFSGFHEGLHVQWLIGQIDEQSIPSVCQINAISLTKHIQVYKEIPKPTTGCYVPPSYGYTTHIIELDRSHESEFPYASNLAELTIKTKSSMDSGYFGGNIMIVLKSRRKITWTVNADSMIGNIMIVTNGMADTPRQSNVMIRKISSFPDYGPDDFIEFITKEYGMVASYTKTDSANSIIFTAPESSNNNTATETPLPIQPPSIEEVVAAIDVHKTVKCLENSISITWPSSSLDSIGVVDVTFSDYTCSGTAIGRDTALISRYTQCGFTKAASYLSVIHSNDVMIYLADGRQSQITVQCQIYDYIQLDKASLYDVYNLAIYNDQSFNTKAEETLVREQGYVFFEANLVNISDPNMSAVLEECFISPTKANSVDRHTLISQTCPMDDSIEFINNNFLGIREDKSQKIKFRMTKYFTNYTNYFLHCKVMMCSRDTTPNIPTCSRLQQDCRKVTRGDNSGAAVDIKQQEFILAGPIYISTVQTNDGVVITSNSTDTPLCNDRAQPRFIGTPLLIGIALGSFALGILLTVLVVHCVTHSKQVKQQQSTDLYRFENRSMNNVYEPLKVYDVFPQGHPLNRTNSQPVPPQPVPPYPPATSLA